MWSPTFWKQQLEAPTSLTQSQTRPLTTITRTRSFPARTPKQSTASTSSEGTGTGTRSGHPIHLLTHTNQHTAHTNPVTVRCWDLQKLDGHSPSHRRRDQHSKSLSIPPRRARHYTIPRYIHNTDGTLQYLLGIPACSTGPASTRLDFHSAHDTTGERVCQDRPIQLRDPFFLSCFSCWLESDKTD